MRQILWALLLGTISICLSAWFVVTQKINHAEQRHQTKQVHTQAKSTPTQPTPKTTLKPAKNSPASNKKTPPRKEQDTKKSSEERLLRKQIYNQLTNAVTAKTLQTLNIQLLKDGTLVIPLRISNHRLSKELQIILSKVLPPYLKILSQPHFSQRIQQVNIEAHTSSKWHKNSNKQESFQKNKVLSNQQARAVENYLYELLELKYLHQWMARKIAPVGHSFQKLIYDESGKENTQLSKRIEMRIILKK